MGESGAATTGRMGARVAVGAGCALLAACLAGTPLLVSASATGAVQLQVEQTCPSELALFLDFYDHDAEASLEAQADELEAAAPPRTTKLANATIGGLADGIDRPARLVDLEGQGANVTPQIDALAASEIAASRDVLGRLDE